jgi:hypothetical protein
MIGWDGLTAISTFALAATGLLTALYVRRQLEDFRREAKIKHLIDLVEQFEREPLATYRRQLAMKRFSSDTLAALNLDEPPDELHDVLNFFEHMGYLLDGGYIELQAVSTEFHFWIFNIWADAKDLVKYEQADDSVYYLYL